MEKKPVMTMVKDEKLIEKRRKQMIKAAIKLFKEKGFHKTTTREIAREAGFSIGTLYEYIRQKEDILYLVCDAIYDQFRERMEQEVSYEGGDIDLLKRTISAYIELVHDMQDEMLVMYQELKSLAKDSLPYVLKKEMEMAAIFERILTTAVNEKVLSLTEDEIKAAAHNILIVGQMWAFRRWALQRFYSLDEYIQMQTRLLLEGIRRAGEGSENVLTGGGRIE